MTPANSGTLPGERGGRRAWLATLLATLALAGCSSMSSYSGAGGTSGTSDPGRDYGFRGQCSYPGQAVECRGLWPG
jgi:hypothetical protein